jgi:hypothetical protein
MLPYPLSALFMPMPRVQSASVKSVPDDWRSMKFFAKRSLALRLTGKTGANAAEVDALISAHIAGK